MLLCGRFGGERGDQSPLTQKEYEALARWLLDRKLRPADLLSANEALLGELVLAKLDSAKVSALLHRGTALSLSLEKWRRSGLWVLSRSDPSYPSRLKKKLGQSAPPLLYGAGDPGLLDVGGVAIIGSRDATESGLEFTRDLARACVRDGMGVISGGAKGVDAAAMQGGGEAGGLVVGVLSSDLLRASVNRQNRQGLQSGHLVLVSPFNPESGFNAGNAMARNRYIYALADFAVVVDSAEGEGGTWSGAIEDLRRGWTPLYVRDPGEGAGNRALIAKGGISFTYAPGQRESLRDYLSIANQEDASSLFSPNATIPDTQVVETESLAEKSNPPVIEAIEKVVTEEAIVDSPTQVAPLSLDMFQAFMDRLPVLLKDGAKTDEEIRLALGLEKGQAKTWLASAVSSGFLEKRKKPVSYALVRQITLC